MSIPGSIAQILATLVLVIPGFVFQIVRIRLLGRKPGDNEITTRILTAIAVSTMFALAYIVCIGETVADTDNLQDEALRHPREYALLGLLAAFVIPVIVACIYALVSQSGWWTSERWAPHSERWTRIDPRPTAWDAVFGNLEECFIRVRTRDKTWYAGWFGARSYASSFPDPQSLYVEVAYKIDDNGQLGQPIEGSNGAIIDCSDAVWIELLVSPEQAASGTMEDHGGAQ